jgi:hypothetical protein
VVPYTRFVSGIGVAVVGSVQVISGTGGAVLGWRYDVGGNSQEGGKQRQKEL